MKRLVLCLDGTWNKLDASHPTNVLFTAESVLPQTSAGVAQIVYYDEGVGTDDGEALTGGIFGAGLAKNLSDAYRFLTFNYAPGDEIVVFGFSRGAYTARSLVSLLATCGLVSRRNAGRADEAIAHYRRRQATDEFRERMLAFRLECSPGLCISDSEDTWRAGVVPGHITGKTPPLRVAYLGVWDTVGALGIPGYFVFADALNRGFQFHDVNLSQLVRRARHAVAIDERKRDFEPTLWDNLDQLNVLCGFDPADEGAPYQQVWFPGVHGAVGGGGERRGLSDDALDWIWEGARRAGLELDDGPGSRGQSLRPSHLDPLDNRPPASGGIVTALLDALPKADRLPGPSALHQVSRSARLRWKEPPDRLPENAPYRPRSLSRLAKLLE